MPPTKARITAALRRLGAGGLSPPIGVDGTPIALPEIAAEWLRQLAELDDAALDGGVDGHLRGQWGHRWPTVRDVLDHGRAFAARRGRPAGGSSCGRCVDGFREGSVRYLDERDQEHITVRMARCSCTQVPGLRADDLERHWRAVAERKGYRILGIAWAGAQGMTTLTPAQRFTRADLARQRSGPPSGLTPAAFVAQAGAADLPVPAAVSDQRAVWDGEADGDGGAEAWAT